MGGCGVVEVGVGGLISGLVMVVEVEFQIGSLGSGGGGWVMEEGGWVGLGAEFWGWGGGWVGVGAGWWSGGWVGLGAGFWRGVVGLGWRAGWWRGGWVGGWVLEGGGWVGVGGWLVEGVAGLCRAEMMEIEMGSVYKLDHQTKLPKSTAIPASLNSIKAVMVNNKSDDDVTVVFPSMKSIRNFFGNKKVTGLMQPNLDEHYVMGLNVSKKLLVEKVSFEDFAVQRGKKSFWVNVDDNNDNIVDDDDDKVEEDDHQLSNNGLEIKWGKRRRATFYGKQRSDCQTKMSILPCLEKEEASSTDEEEVEEEEEEKEELPEKSRILRKRKCHFKGVKYRETKKKKNKKQIKKVSEKKLNDSQHRWTVERYKLAEKNMLKILKEKGAGPMNPILRPDLRSEARKLIGDTGLLDHLLKHMAGKIAPGGKDRFRRRHNPEGAMEYWLESAELVEIRKQAGVTDPYWVPPPGWKPGDCPNQDPVCAMQLKELKDEVADMKRKNENNQAMNVDPQSFEDSVESLKGLHQDLIKKKAHIEKQLLDISNTFSGMEGKIRWLKDAVTVTKEDKHNQFLLMAEKEKDKKTAAINDQITEDKQSATTTTTAAEEKEKRRQKLKSGFRICKPQGTFLWPSQIAAAAASSSSPSSPSQVAVNLEDLLGFPTPPSVSSSCCSKPPFFLSAPPLQQQPPSPRVKRPVATRASVTLNISIANIRGSTTIESISSPTSTATAATGFSSVHSFVPDLNEGPLSSVA
ncbi:Protein DYAD [Bienertia sinuspersici]